MAIVIDLYATDAHDENEIVKSLNAALVNFLGGPDEVAHRFNVSDGDIMKRIRFTITTTKFPYEAPSPEPTDEEPSGN